MLFILLLSVFVSMLLLLHHSMSTHISERSSNTHTDYYPPNKDGHKGDYNYKGDRLPNMRNENGEKGEEEILSPPHLMDKHLPNVKERVEGMKREYERYEPVQCPPEPGENGGRMVVGEDGGRRGWW